MDQAQETTPKPIDLSQEPKIAAALPTVEMGVKDVTPASGAKIDGKPVRVLYALAHIEYPANGSGGRCIRCNHGIGWDDLQGFLVEHEGRVSPLCRTCVTTACNGGLGAISS